MKPVMLMPGLQVPRSAPPSCQRKAKEQVRRFRRGERNYKNLHVKGKHAPGRAWMKIDIGTSWRLLSRKVPLGQQPLDAFALWAWAA
ncbi:hypothetical protein G3164_004495 [Salmonella enterica subsp. enterica serovar Montevideo]|nr:hypothetical protein [Salmonella enterica subsp. enterica serovar Montevideo]EEK7813003.1 hypothetical protein [Salmonella enterica subsp. enterica serovar Montevideo]EEL0142965.1 hypothetical protein [Salmonella enterica subsp. enterica serovar Montevideo]